MPSEAPIHVESREELIYLLSQASELEHGLMCEYLFAMFSLKRQAKEGPSPGQLEAAGRWDRMIAQVAAQEMLHLALVSNLLTAIGAVPHFERPNFPQRAKYYPPGVQLALVPFGEVALRHFLYLERPEGMDLADADGFEVLQAAAPITDDAALVPFEQDYATVGHLYRGVEQGLEHLVQRYGEQRLFIGPPTAQVTGSYFRWAELIQITDLASARLAIDTILEQGEGCRGEWRNAHFGRFHRILEEFLELQRQDPEYEPARPVVPAYVRPPTDVADPVLISDPTTARVADLFNACYELLLQLLLRLFVHGSEGLEELTALSNASQNAMFDVLKPLGYLLTSLPVGPELPGKTAGPTFDFYRTGYILPHRHAAWLLLHERATGLADACGLLAEQTGHEVLASVEGTLRALAGLLAAGL
jgi:hypothetical protein